ncbi:fungal-specific transcription factor domain-containing protein [Halenospora varia]|nr:fungal-specific transcription factor domain-containing protein [Halenospora varia]
MSSKVKCVNDGIKSTCTACTESGRNCQYASVSNSASKRPEITAKIKQEDDKRPKTVRKIEDGERGKSSQVEDPLSDPVLTKKVWDEVYDMFKLHFSAEMPFLYPPAFRNLMRQASNPRDPSIASTDLQDGGVLLLAVLTLTARFHPELVAHHFSNGLGASEYYATALKTAINPIDSIPTSPSVYNVQAFLMLGLYEWGQTRGLSAWIYIGIAIRLAQAMELPYEDHDGDRNIDPTASHEQLAEDRERIIEKEVKRRTLWSCFIMDRMLSAGKYRSTMISVKQLKVQLPCSDDDFLFVRDATTEFLDKPVRADKIVNDDRVLARYVRLGELFGRLSEWSCAGDSSTQFFKLRQELENFHDTLPSNLIFTTTNLSAYIEKRNATTYVSMHTLYSVCRIILHREYIPFIPLLCTRPQGPLDAPVFPENQYHIPSGFWEKSAESIFKAARDIVDIVRTCQGDDALPESPQIVFSVWQAAFVCLYADHFQHMDVGDQNDDHRTEGYMGLSVKILRETVSRLNMAKGYLGMLEKMHNYFSNVKIEFQEGFQNWSGVGGLENYKTLEKHLKDFGSLHDTDESVASDSLDSVDQACFRASANDIGKESIELALKPRNWIAANSKSPANETDDRKVSSSQGYHYNTNHQQSLTQNSIPPSLVNSGLGINLLYEQSQSYFDSGQQQHRPVSISVGQLNMAPPTEVNVTWTERMNASAYNNNVLLAYAETRFDGSPANMRNFETQNSAQIHDLWRVPNTVMAGQEGFISIP